MACEVEFTDEFEQWWDGLSGEEQEDISAVVGVLEEKGPALRRPYVGSIASSRHPNMKELVAQHAGRPYRILFAFDPKRHAVLLIGGDKTGNKHWYVEFVPQADAIFDEHLVGLKKDAQKE
jgi:hypothetical protein